jgi:hypothetical protein
MSSTAVNTRIPCPWCSSEYNFIYHSGRCPIVKSIEYYQDGRIKKVEYVEPYIYGQTEQQWIMIDGELRVVEDSSPPGLKPLPDDAGILSVRN